MHDSYSAPNIQALMEDLAGTAITYEVDTSFDRYIAQACERTLVTNTVKFPRPRVPWHDHECYQKRSIAIKSGERVNNETGRQKQRHVCGDLKAYKERKQQTICQRCIADSNMLISITELACGNCLKR